MPPAPPPAPRKPTPVWIKLVLGCAILAGIAILVAVGLALWGVIWMVSPGEQQALEAAVSPHSRGVIRFADLAGDPGVRALAADFMTEAMEAEDARRRRELPSSLRWVEGFQRAQRAQSAGGMNTALGWFLPKEAVLSFEPGPGGASSSSPLFAANFRGFVRPVRWFVENAAKDEPGTSRAVIGGHAMFDFADGPAVAFVGGTLVLSSDAGALSPALGRFARTEGGPPSPLLAELGELGSWDVAGVLAEPEAVRTVLGLLNVLAPVAAEEDPPGEGEPAGEEAPETAAADHAELAAEEEEIEEEETAQASPGWALWAAKRLRFGLNVQSADGVSAELLVTYRDQTTAAGAVPLLIAWLDRLREGAAEDGMELHHEVEARGAEVRLLLDLTGVGNAIEAMMARVATEDEEGEEP